MDGKVTSPRSYWSQSHSQNEMIPVVFDAVRSKGCSFETLNTVSHSAAGKAIGIVKQAMNSGCYKWNVSCFRFLAFLPADLYSYLNYIFCIPTFGSCFFHVSNGGKGIGELSFNTACELDEETGCICSVGSRNEL